MQRELEQSVLVVAGKNGSVVSATLATFLTGVANFFDVMQPILGGCTSVLAIIITYTIFKKRDKLIEKEIELRDAQIKAISERREERAEP